MIRLLKKEWFLVGMLLAIGLAMLLPQPGESGGALHLELVTPLGIALIFFLHGVAMSPQAIRKGLSCWKLHLFTQAATFIVYPLIWVLFGHWFTTHMPLALAFGFCYLLALPSTISSSVAMTSVGHGNIPGAIFNASLSSVMGIIITPLYVQLFMGQTGGALSISHTVVHIAEMLLLPMVVGQLLRPWLGDWIKAHKSITNKVDKLVILLIVYNAFCDSVKRGIWHSFSVQTLLMAVLLCVLILAVITTLLIYSARGLRFTKEDEIAGLFCGTKKTLAAGVPMGQVIFATNPMLGMILLPIMLYHPMQIFICAILANRYARRDSLPS